MVTRAFYARADLDLLLSSPVSAQKSLRRPHRARSRSRPRPSAVPLAAPFINVLAYAGGPRWLGAYGVLARDGLRGDGACGRADGRPVPHARAEAHAPRRADRRGDRRRRPSSSACRRWRSSPPTRLSRFAALAVRSCCKLSRPDRTARSGGRRAPSWATFRPSSRSSRCQLRARSAADHVIFSARFAEHATAAAGISATSHPAAPAAPTRSARPRRPACCGARNGRCSGAIPGSSRRR